MKKALFINGNRNAYHPTQCEDYTCTVGELKEFLEPWDNDMKIFLRNDNGYTYGSIDCYGDIYNGEYDVDEVFVDE